MPGRRRRTPGETVVSTPVLVVQVSGAAPGVHSLEGGAATVGRATDNSVVVDLPFVPPHLASLSQSTDGLLLTPVSKAGVLVHRGRTLKGPMVLVPGDFVRVSGPHAGEMVTLVSAVEESAAGGRGVLPLRPGFVVRVGRGVSSDIGRGEPSLALKHAEITCDEDGVHLFTLGRAVTEVNGEVAAGQVSLPDGAMVVAGALRMQVSRTSLRFAIGDDVSLPDAPHDVVHALHGEGGALLEALHLKREVRAGVNLLQDINLRLRPRELVVVVGLSGAGKSTLLDALAGYRPASSGQVLVDNTDLYEHFARFRPRIGFVPQKDIIHLDLTVREALDYAAQLRLPPGTSHHDRSARVEQVMADLDLTGRADLPVKQLSGGQQKRVSIGVELITSPPLFFLDEPTSGLDPGTETQLMQLLRRLADQGRTVIVITHATKNLALADKVAFLARGGHLAWYGPPTEAVDYFDRFRTPTERERHAEMSFDGIYSMVEDPERGDPADWDERFRAYPAYDKYIAGPLRLSERAASPEPTQPPPEALPQVSALRQLLVLSARNVRLISRDRFSLALMLAAPWILAAMAFLITTQEMFDPRQGSVIRVSIELATMAVNAVLVGALSLSREVVKDNQIYRRERLVNLKLVPYVLSKAWVAVLLSLYQAIPWVAVLFLSARVPGGAGVAAGLYVTMFLTVLSGTMLGLLASAAAPTEGSVTLILALLIIPQVLFNGSLIPYPLLGAPAQAVTVPMTARWSFESLMTQTEVGRDLVEHPENCRGEQLFSHCDFPGIRAFYQPAVSAPAPVAPAAPPPSASSREQVAYLGSQLRYQADFVTWKSAHDRPIAAAEAVLDAEKSNYGYLLDVDVSRHWAILAAIILGVLLAVTGVQKLKDTELGRKVYA